MAAPKNTYIFILLCIANPVSTLGCTSSPSHQPCRNNYTCLPQTWPAKCETKLCMHQCARWEIASPGKFDLLLEKGILEKQWNTPVMSAGCFYASVRPDGAPLWIRKRHSSSGHLTAICQKTAVITIRIWDDVEAKTPPGAGDKLYHRQRPEPLAFLRAQWFPGSNQIACN